MSFEHFRSFQKKNFFSSIKVIINKPPKPVLFHEKKGSKSNDSFIAVDLDCSFRWV